MGRADELLPVQRSGGVPGPPDTPPSDEQRRHLEISEHRIDGGTGHRTRVLVYRPREADSRPPLVVSMHGGAFCFERPETSGARDAALALRHQAVVVAVDYRLAPEHRFPAALDDCYTTVGWSVAELGVDIDRVVLVGASAGATLAAAVALMARDRSGPAVRYQALVVPVLDDRLDTASMRQWRDTAPDALDARQAEGMWLHYLGEDADRTVTSPYAAPARATDMAGLPDAYVQVHGRDPLRDEGLDFAARLLAAGSSVDVYCNGAANHSHAALADPLSDQVLGSAIARALAS